MQLEAALRQLEIRGKAKRLRHLWPTIEARLAQGVSHAEILGLLNRNGLELTERTYKSYLYRDRKRRRTAGQVRSQMRQEEVTTPQAAALARAPTFPGTAKVQGRKRPPTFDFDPRGIPELLK